MRNELEEVTRQLEGVVRTSHGEGESLMLVGHMVHALVYTSHISRTLHSHLQHVWPPAKQPKAKMEFPKGLTFRSIVVYVIGLVNLAFHY